MKTEFMAAPGSRLQAPGSRLQALIFRPQERGSSSKRNLYRLFRTAAAIIAFAVSSVLVPSSAFAHGDGDGYGGESHYDGGCNSQYKVAHGDTECLHVWWDNTPPASTLVVGGSTYGAKNHCSEYGDIRAHIDVVGDTDMHFHLDNGSKKRGKKTYYDVSGGSCCINESDLCYKQQVEKRRGKIKVWSGSGTTMETVNVSSHTKRYVYCNDNPDSVYCVNDPEGDAFTVPELLCGPGGNRRECRASDCQWAFNHAEHDNVGHYCTLDSYSYEDGFCTLDATCSRPADGYGELSADIEIYLRHIKKKLHVCGGSQGYYLFHVDNDSCS